MSDVLVYVGTSSRATACAYAADYLVQQLTEVGMTVRLVEQAGSSSLIVPEILAHLGQASLVLVVGYSASLHASKSLHHEVALACALPDIPSSADALYSSAVTNLQQITANSDYVLVDDEASRSLVEYYVAGATGHIGTFSNITGLNRLIDDAQLRVKTRHRVLISSHDFRFIYDVVHMLQRLDGVEVRMHTWKLSAEEPTGEQLRDIQWATTIVSEWAGRNAVWLSQHKQPHQRLIVRLHGFEARSVWINNLNFDAVDQMIVVSRFYRNTMIETFGWDPAKVEAIGNSIDTTSFDRPTLAGAEYHLGMLGFTPLLKRPHAAVELLRLLLQKDKRYTLHLRGESPWNHGWLWRDVQAADAYRQLYALVGADETLRSHVVFESPGSNIESWFSRIGWVLSLSSRETFHLAAAEGMASGAVPVFLNREGVAEIFSDKWVFGSPQEIADYIHSVVSHQLWANESAFAQAFARRFDFEGVADDWRRVILGE